MRARRRPGARSAPRRAGSASSDTLRTRDARTRATPSIWAAAAANEASSVLKSPAALPPRGAQIEVGRQHAVEPDRHRVAKARDHHGQRHRQRQARHHAGHRSAGGVALVARAFAGQQHQRPPPCQRACQAAPAHTPAPRPRRPPAARPPRHTPRAAGLRSPASAPVSRRRSASPRPAASASARRRGSIALSVPAPAATLAQRAPATRRPRSPPRCRAHRTARAASHDHCSCGATPVK